MIITKLKHTFFLFLIFSSIIGQENQNEYNFVPINDGFTQSAITTILKDSEGFTWIGTNSDGLFKYNSTDFKSYKQELNSKKASLNSSIVYTTFQDSKYNIWVGTELGLNLYNKELDKFENIELLKDQKKINIPVHAITEYDENTLLFGTHEHGLYKLDKKTLSSKLIKFKDNEPTISLQINAIVKSSNGRFLIGTNQGLMTFDPYDEILQLAKFNTKNDLEFIENAVESLLVTENESVWIGTVSSGLYKITSNKNDVYAIEKYAITKKRIMSLAEKQNSNILCATENDGLFEINPSTKLTENYRQNKLNNKGVKSNSIWTVFTDDKNRVWLGYYNYGIDIHDDYYNKFNSIKSLPFLKNSLNSNSVTGIAKDDFGRLWMGMFDGGVDVYDPKKGTFTNLFNQNNGIAKGLNNFGITAVFIDSHKNIWIGTWSSGLYLLKYNSKKFINVNKTSNKSIFTTNRIMTFDEDSKGNIWIGTFLSGLYSYHQTSQKFTHYKSENFLKYNIHKSNIRKVLVDKNDAIWIGSREGVYKVENTNSNTFNVSSFNNEMNSDLENNSNYSIKSNIIYSLFEDSNSNIWIGTLGNGLSKYNAKNNTFKRYNTNNGLIHETIFSIIEDKDKSIWIGGNKGLSALNTQTNTFTNFNKTDGLLSNTFNYNAVLKDENNVLFFGNSKGINYFNPSEIVYNKEKPIVYIKDLKLSNDIVSIEDENSPLKKIISKTDELTLTYKQAVFSLDYSGINYTRSENNQYAYFLKGFDKDWSFVGTNRNASYKNVPPGNYTFMVKASNNDGYWNDNPTTLKIKILPAWWATNTAILTYLLLLGLFIYVVYKYVRARVREKIILNLERQEYKQFEALNAKKIQFFTNISHEFRTPLTLILTPLEDILESNNLISDDLKEKHNIIYKNAKRLSRLINELMDFRKLQFNKMSINASQISVVPFIEEVVSHFEEQASLQNIKLSVEYDQNNFIIWSDPSMLEKIIFNLLSNAFKATPANGSITVQINKPEKLISLPLVTKTKSLEAIEIIIKDTGLGIKKENLHKVFDRFFQGNEKNNQYNGGTGIGLELVKNFVDLHKGKVILTSKENIGTQFKIYFPLGYEHLKENTNNKFKETVNESITVKNKPADNAITEEKEVPSKKMILIVEDTAELRSYIRNELKEDYIVKEAENGLEGLEKANKYLPDILITDVMMPIMDGFELCERIKSDIKTSHIPILMVTAKGMQIDKLKGIDSGADVYLNKPFNMKVLKSHLKQLISSRQILFDKYFNSVSTTIDANNTTSLDKEFMNNVLSYINENINDEKLNVEHLASELFLSRSKLYRKIKALTGDTANEFIRKVRLEKAKQLIKNTEHTISEICFKVGFSSPSYFTKCFKDHFDVLPTELRENATEK